ncbi:uncharacterized protein C8Q71DRAFT_721035 [Rhodofomes roseus]|uniref:Uncharacterized protein n=1 Tax=Rhodofomes roseus TaxID=34475 RepID=A0ABQ8KU91_9APHY|nr:uncharacterized protein C8Q71DRAFT_721035 [Rhodofomes roseus]KAH9841996.1 hypothetical protein C8Q71DRAFT_721035 [Rhodofomes roseus]
MYYQPSSGSAWMTSRLIPLSQDLYKAAQPTASGQKWQWNGGIDVRTVVPCIGKTPMADRVSSKQPAAASLTLEFSMVQALHDTSLDRLAGHGIPGPASHAPRYSETNSETTQLVIVALDPTTPVPVQYMIVDTTNLLSLNRLSFKIELVLATGVDNEFEVDADTDDFSAACSLLFPFADSMLRASQKAEKKLNRGITGVGKTSGMAESRTLTPATDLPRGNSRFSVPGRGAEPSIASLRVAQRLQVQTSTSDNPQAQAVCRRPVATTHSCSYAECTLPVDAPSQIPTLPSSRMYGKVNSRPPQHAKCSPRGSIRELPPAADHALLPDMSDVYEAPDVDPSRPGKWCRELFCTSSAGGASRSQTKAALLACCASMGTGGAMREREVVGVTSSWTVIIPWTLARRAQTADTTRLLRPNLAQSIRQDNTLQDDGKHRSTEIIHVSTSIGEADAPNRNTAHQLHSRRESHKYKIADAEDHRKAAIAQYKRAGAGDDRSDKGDEHAHAKQQGVPPWYLPTTLLWDQRLSDRNISAGRVSRTTA